MRTCKAAKQAGWPKEDQDIALELSSLGTDKSDHSLKRHVPISMRLGTAHVHQIKSTPSKSRIADTPLIWQAVSANGAIRTVDDGLFIILASQTKTY